MTEKKSQKKKNKPAPLAAEWVKDKEPYLNRGNVYLARLDDKNWVVTRSSVKDRIWADGYRYYHQLESAINAFLAQCARDIYEPERPLPLAARMHAIRNEMADAIHAIYSGPLFIEPTMVDIQPRDDSKEKAPTKGSSKATTARK